VRWSGDGEFGIGGIKLDDGEKREREDGNRLGDLR
jgi:hypothetical protein